MKLVLEQVEQWDELYNQLHSKPLTDGYRMPLVYVVLFQDAPSSLPGNVNWYVHVDRTTHGSHFYWLRLRCSDRAHVMARMFTIEDGEMSIDDLNHWVMSLFRYMLEMNPLHYVKDAKCKS